MSQHEPCEHTHTHEWKVQITDTHKRVVSWYYVVVVS
jgi:hypothetical protein